MAERDELNNEFVQAPGTRIRGRRGLRRERGIAPRSVSMRKVLFSTCLAAGLALAPLPVGQAALAAPQAVIAAVKSVAKSDRELRAW